MSLIAKDAGNFNPAPAGLSSAVCLDVVDMGVLKQTWNGKEKEVHKCRFLWEIAELMEDGRRFTIGKWYTVSLHEKSTLRKDLKSWRGRDFTKEELAGFDLEKVVGARCRLVIMHEEKAGKTYANVTAIMPSDKATAIVPIGGYIRVKDRDQAQKAEAGGNGTTASNGNDLGAGDPFDAEPHDDGDPFDDPSYMNGEAIPF
jgi:hypothetical protein